MTEQEKIYFEALTKDRSDSADTLKKPSMRGIMISVVEKYSDQAHFIYELLQNADDAKATSARFVLHKDKLVFAHNGTRRFSISNPATEEEDSKNKALGDINSITSVANSNKSEASIGKFGVGFKSVFQYTSTPYIYDPNIYFKIDRFIVPTKVNEDFSGRRKDETLFVFPFDHPKRGEAEAYEDIFEKVRSLDYPLLFLSYLKDITLEIPGALGLYGKSILQKRQFGDTVAECIRLTQNDGDEFYDDNLWLFSRKDGNLHKYSVGFFLDEKEKLTAKKHSAFCFFLTKEATELNFIVHAPFLLTDSREGIRAGIQHNKDMIELLATLAADSLVYLKEIGQERGTALIDDNIFNIIPYDKRVFNDINDKSKISFKPFYTSIKNKLDNEELLPSFDGFVTSENAYWASVPEIASLFSNKQLAELIQNDNAKWVFTSIGREESVRSRKELANYVDELIEEWYNHEKIINYIKGVFIEKQTFEWLHKLYKYIGESNARKLLIKTKPVFIDKNRKAVPAFDSNGQAILFLPTDDVSDYVTINATLLENDDTVEFVNKLGITAPSLKDEIYNKILPQYKDGKDINTDPHFLKFFKYYKDCPHAEAEKYIKLIKDYEFICYYTADDDVVYRGKGSDLYFPKEDLLKWFKSKPNTKFVQFDNYMQLVGAYNEKFLRSFLTELGVANEPRVLSKKLSEGKAYEIKSNWNKPTYYNMGTRKWTEWCIDGLEEKCWNKTSEDSLLLWAELLKTISTKFGWRTKFWRITNGEYEYFYRNQQFEWFESSTARLLHGLPWLLNSDNEFVFADDLTLQTISPLYDINSKEAQELLSFLNIKDEVIEVEDNNLTDEQRAKIEFADKYADIPPEDLEKFAEQCRANKQKAPKDITPEPDGGVDDRGEKASPTITRLVNEITKRVVSPRAPSTFIPDEDDYAIPTIDYSKKIEQAKQRSANEIESIVELEKLQQQALEYKKYTSGWFKSLLALEALESGENNANTKKISISFAKVEREAGTERTLILKHPNRYIPHSMEDLADILLVLHYGDHTKNVAVEVVNVKSYTLRAKLKTNAEVDGVDLSLVTEARIDVKDPVFLLEELRKQFAQLGFDDHYNLQKNLCENIEFVFGPPGTGKTTYLAKNVLLPIMRSAEELKILVLTPTNKAADVLVRSVMEIMGTDTSYNNWLVRFGVTNDATIEQSGVYKDKTFDIRSFTRNVTVTTIARFPYDYFMPDNTRLHLYALKWDYIVIDEASMIPLVNIIYPLYKKTPKKFIIAGDPFQIEPITSIDLWKNENIYTMVELNSFTNPTTIPHQYSVQLLTTQYRSVPAIGEVFSRFLYGGILQHNRTADSQRPLLIEEFIDVKPLNIIKFPVSKYESIYRPKRLQGKSNYQVYSALFAFEFVKYLSSRIELANENSFFRIGVIAPYRAQSDLIDKLMASAQFSKNIDVQVGTIHGFQGDECDIIISVFNSPPSISKSTEMFLNKPNIINVSISRARDYLFVIMPDDETENVDNLELVKQIEKLCKEQSDWAQKHSYELEELMFGSARYLEDNSFSTSHQLVNVYGKPERRYEVRSEDTAVDVQIHNP